MNRHQRRAEASSARAASVTRANALMRRLTQNAERFDARLAERVASSPVASRITCTPGCAHCCNQVITITLAEALHIVDKYDPLCRKLLPVILEHDDAMLNSGFDMNSVARLHDPATSADREKFLQWWYGQQIPCVFLDPERKLCRVYDRRPLACRSHLVMDDPSICADVTKDNLVFDPGMPYVEAMNYSIDETIKLVGVPLLGFVPSMLKHVLGIPGGRVVQ